MPSLDEYEQRLIDDADDCSAWSYEQSASSSRCRFSGRGQVIPAWRVAAVEISNEPATQPSA